MSYDSQYDLVSKNKLERLVKRGFARIVDVKSQECCLNAVRIFNEIAMTSCLELIDSIIYSSDEKKREELCYERNYLVREDGKKLVSGVIYDLSLAIRKYYQRNSAFNEICERENKANEGYGNNIENMQNEAYRMLLPILSATKRYCLIKSEGYRDQVFVSDLMSCYVIVNYAVKIRSMVYDYLPHLAEYNYMPYTKIVSIAEYIGKMTNSVDLFDKKGNKVSVNLSEIVSTEEYKSMSDDIIRMCLSTDFQQILLSKCDGYNVNLSEYGKSMMPTLNDSTYNVKFYSSYYDRKYKIAINQRKKSSKK